jgi:hypothetical protein
MRAYLDRPAQSDEWRAELPFGAAMRVRQLPRLVTVDEDASTLQLLLDVAGADFEVTSLISPVTMPEIAAAEPDLILIGGMGCDGGAGLTTEEIVTLAARHMTLRAVPIVLMTSDPVMAQGERLRAHPSITLVSVPFDAQTIRAVLASVSRRAVRGSAARLPAVCVHGYDGGSCPRCG